MAEGSQTLVRGLRLLELISQGNEGVSVRDLARQCELPVSIVQRLLVSLESEGYIGRHASGVGYRLTAKLWRMGSGTVGAVSAKDIARPHLVRISRSTSETAKLSILDGQDAVTVDMVEGGQPVRVFVPIGGVVGAAKTASGRAMLAFRDDFQIDDPELAETLREVRAKGYAVNLGVWQQGVGAVAAPVFSATGTVVASIGLVLPLIRLNAQKAQDLGKLCISAAESLSSELGYSGTRANEIMKEPK